MKKYCDTPPELLDWLWNGDVGVSSKTIVGFLCGLGPDRPFGYSHPFDSGDFWRCESLLRHCPSLREHLPQMAELSPQWARLVGNWQSIVELLEAENNSAARDLIRACIE